MKMCWGSCLGQHPLVDAHTPGRCFKAFQQEWAEGEVRGDQKSFPDKAADAHVEMRRSAPISNISHKVWGPRREITADFKVNIAIDSNISTVLAEIS